MDNMIKVAFAATDKEWEQLIPQQIEVEGVKEYVQWGKDNQYPEYLYGLFNDVSSLKTIIEGTADYVCGNDVTCNVKGFDVEYISRASINSCIHSVARFGIFKSTYSLTIPDSSDIF